MSTPPESIQSNWGIPTPIHFGAGRIAELGTVCRSHGIDRPLVVTDPGLAELDPVAQAAAALDAAGCRHGLFTGVRPNPTGADVDAGVAAYSIGEHDGVVALGGGSALDVGKVIALMSGQHRPVWDFEDIGDNWTRADEAGIAPVIAIPTTAGTGSEVGRAGVVTDVDAGTKKIIFHPKMLPAAVICDPTLTVALPRVLTVGTGLDALSHSLEAHSAPGYHPVADGIALEGIRLVFDNLPRVADDPTDIEARGHMMSAAAMGAIAFQKGLGGMHALAHPIGAVFDTHHGMTNATLMPYVMMFNSEHIRPRLDRAAPYLGVPGGFEGVVERVLQLRADLDVPHTLGELGVDTDRLSEIPAKAVADPSAGGNPRAFDLAAAERILTAAADGSLDGLAG